MNDIRKDIIEATRIITNPFSIREVFSKYNKLYLYTTENIKEYMIDDLSEKSVLSVTGSGDHFLNAAYMNASVIDTFDINKLTIYLLKLKKCAISYLSCKSQYKNVGKVENKNVGLM